MSVATPSRRALLQGVSAGAVAAALPSPRALAARQAIVGLIYVGARDDFGWNQSHAVAARALKAVPGVKVVEEEGVPETIAVAKSMESMITLDGANLIFPTSFGYFDLDTFAGLGPFVFESDNYIQTSRQMQRVGMEGFLAWRAAVDG